MKLDVIIAIYNVEKYVNDLIDSLNNQTLNKNFYNIIFVNDGSIDKTIQIIEKNMSKSINYKILTKKNGGLSDARNYGIINSTSEYLMFIDGDDYVTNDYLEKMLEKIETTKSDIVLCETFWVYENKIITEKIKSTYKENNFENIKTLFDSSIAAWNKIYKRELFSDNMFTKNLLFEDLDFMLQIINKINKINFIYEPLVFYRQSRKESIINTNSKKDIDSYKYIFEKYSRLYKNTIYFELVEKYFIRRMILSMSKKYLNTNLEQYYVESLEKLFIDYKDITSNDEYINNSILIKLWIKLIKNKKYKVIKILSKML